MANRAASFAVTTGGPGTTPSSTALMRSRLERYFETSLLLLLTAGFVTVASTGAIDTVSVAFVSIALIVRGWFLLTGRKVSMPIALDSYFTFGYVAFYAADYFFLSRSFVNATVHLILFSMVVKIFSVRRDRDYVYLAVLAFTEVLAASVLTVDTVFLGAFAIFSLLVVNTFLAFEIRRSWNAAPSRPRTVDSAGNGHDAPSRFVRGLSATTVSLVVTIILIGSGIFFVLPRMRAGYFGRFMPRNRIESGFTDNVSFGQIGEIQQSDAVAMHIQIDGDTTGSHDLRWRGVALARFDGQQWSNDSQRREIRAELPGCFNVAGGNDRYHGYACAAPHPREPKMIKYRVVMEPLGTNVFFLAPKARSLSGTYRELALDDSDAVYNADSRRLVEVYEATSNLAIPTPEQLKSSADYYPAEIKARYAKVPEGAFDERVRQLAQQVTASETNPYDKASEIERYLQTNFAYTLQLPSAPPKDPIAHFLFERKAGHCEYFASAMAVMLRSIGIPSRIVNGFRGGEFNAVSGKYIIRARDAHSWVEVYFPGNGWVAFDPTPAGTAPSAIEHSQFAMYLDAMRDFWREWIINYDVGHQRTLGNMGITRTTTGLESVRLWFRSRYVNLILKGLDARNRVRQEPARWMYGSAAIAGMLLLLLNLRRIVRAIRELRLRRNPEKAPETAATLWYARMLKLLQKRGMKKLATQTPEEFTSTINDPVLHSSVALFTTHYERARFADSAVDAQRLPSLFEAVRMTARRK